MKWQDPVAVEPWTDIKETTSFGSKCTQPHIVTKKIEGSDDCLYLNVYTKTLKSNRKQPVMVWIHGGGFVNGNGGDSTYGPDYLLRKDIVLVTINYRLSILGLLNTYHFML